MPAYWTFYTKEIDVYAAHIPLHDLRGVYLSVNYGRLTNKENAAYLAMRL